ncbi:hypothetical protein [Chryseobacterium sp. JUb7]|nr:hypothetical protein [Chryseobacterium sp. JUb7]MCS3532066.1 hypothetical protein [Chryseobacterium sp. JUb7]
MKSLKEFISENLENSTIIPVQENEEVTENNNPEAVQEGTKTNEDVTKES